MADRSGEVTRLLKRGLTQYGLGDLDSAITSWEEALSLDPSNRAAQDYLDTAREEAGYTSHTPRRPLAPVSLRRPTRPGDEADTPRTLEGVLSTESGTSSTADAEVQDALRALRDGQLDRAYEILERVQRQSPGRVDVESYLTMVRGKRAKEWARQVGDQGRNLRVKVTAARMTQLKLRPDEGFLLSQIDGNISIEQLLSLQSDRVWALEILAKLLRDGVVE